MAHAESADVETAQPPNTAVGKFIFSAPTLRANLVAEKFHCTLVSAEIKRVVVGKRRISAVAEMTPSTAHANRRNRWNYDLDL